MFLRMSGWCLAHWIITSNYYFSSFLCDLTFRFCTPEAQLHLRVKLCPGDKINEGITDKLDSCAVGWFAKKNMYVLPVKPICLFRQNNRNFRFNVMVNF